MRRGAIPGLLRRRRFHQFHEGEALLSAAFAWDHEAADTVVLGVHEAERPVASAVAVGSRRRERQGAGFPHYGPAEPVSHARSTGPQIARMDRRHYLYGRP